MKLFVSLSPPIPDPTYPICMQLTLRKNELYDVGVLRQLMSSGTKCGGYLSWLRMQQAGGRTWMEDLDSWKPRERAKSV